MRKFDRRLGVHWCGVLSRQFGGIHRVHSVFLSNSRFITQSCCLTNSGITFPRNKHLPIYIYIGGSWWVFLFVLV